MKWNKKTDIFALMVGHGKSLDGTWDSGCTYGKYTEADLMLEIVKYAVKILKRCGVRTLTDATKGNNRNMKSSVAWANSKKAKLYMSVHCDYSKASAGVAPLYKTAEDKKMAVEIGKYVAKRMGMKWKGAFKRTDLYELNAPLMPSVIFETGAIKADLKYLKNYKKYGRALACGILKYIGVPYISAKAHKIAKMADKLAYEGQPDEARYPKGKPTKAYKEALNDVYPNRKSWSDASKKGASCDVFAGTVIRSCGVDKKFPRALGSQMKYLEKSKLFTRIKGITYKDLRDGDVIVYKKTSNSGHICIFCDGKIKHAAYKKWYGRTTNNEKSIMSKKDKKGKTVKKWVKVYRIK